MSKNLYVVKIGNTTRKGTFIEHVTRFIETDEEDENRVARYLYDSYRGFEIRVSRAETIEALDIPKPEPKKTEEPAPEAMGQAGDVLKRARVYGIDKVGFRLDSGRFADLFATANNARIEYRKAEIELEKAIRDYIRSKHMVGYVPSGVDIEYTSAAAYVKDVRFNQDISAVDILEFEMNPAKEASTRVDGDE